MKINIEIEFHPEIGADNSQRKEIIRKLDDFVAALCFPDLRVRSWSVEEADE